MRGWVIASTIVIGIGLFDMSGVFYTLLRFVVCVTACIGFVAARRAKVEDWVAVFAVLAVVHNPVMPFYLHSKALWTIVDLVTLVCLWKGSRRLANARGEA